MVYKEIKGIFKAINLIDEEIKKYKDMKKKIKMMESLCMLMQVL